MDKKEIVYVEPASYFPKEIRKKAGIGEYAKESGSKKVKKSTKKSK